MINELLTKVVRNGYKANNFTKFMDKLDMKHNEKIGTVKVLKDGTKIVDMDKVGVSNLKFRIGLYATTIAGVIAANKLASKNVR